MRVLIVRLSAMGDTVCTMPVARAIKENQPDAHITWVVDPRFKSLVDICPDVDQVISSKELDAFRKSAEPFDLALDMQGLLKSGLVLSGFKAKEKLGYHWQREGARLFSAPVKPDKSSIHVVDQYVDVARAAGFSADRAKWRLEPSADDDQQRDTLLSGVKDYAVVHCGGGWASKRWPVANFAEICLQLAERGLTPFLIGAKAEEEVAQEVLTLAPVCLSLVSKTPLRTLTSLIKGARIYVGGDTGATHIAAALNVPAIGIYTVTKPERSCPYGQIANCPAPTLENIRQTVQRLTA